MVSSAKFLFFFITAYKNQKIKNCEEMKLAKYEFNNAKNIYQIFVVVKEYLNNTAEK